MTSLTCGEKLVAKKLSTFILAGFLVYKQIRYWFNLIQSVLPSRRKTLLFGELKLENLFKQELDIDGS